MQIIKALIISTYQLFYVHYKIIIILQNLYIFATGNKNIAKQIMKKTLLTIITATALSSCCTVFTASKQNITFMAPNGTKIYDVETNIKIAEVEDKQLIARKDGYAPTPFILETEFNASSLWNFLFWPGFLVDLGTGKMFKWDNTIINVELEPDTGTNE